MKVSKFHGWAAASVAAAFVTGALASVPDKAPSAKEQMFIDMLALAQQMNELKPMLAEPGAAAAYAQLQSAYQAMSDQLGGADPAAMVNPLGTAPPTGPAPAPAHREEGGIAGNATVPPGCTLDSDIVFNGTAVPIPDLTTVTSTITMSGLTGRIWYVDSIIDISHTFNSDLDIRLTSPSGTTITISSNNGGSNNDVFSSTFFRDNADPDGSAPYLSNNGMVTDHAYVNLTAATPLTPEEPFHAFAGEDPNGVWTLIISDEVGADIGTLNDWDLNVRTTTDPGNRRTRAFGSTGGPFGVLMPDAALFTRTMTVSGFGGYLCDVEIRLDVNHTDCSDLDITLTAPNGDDVTLTTDNASGLDNVYSPTTFNNDVDPGAGATRTVTNASYVNLVAKNALTPEESLATFRGINPNGTWTLRISDDAAADTGVFFGWQLILTTCSCDASCPGDTDGDGDTDADDLTAVILGWGACP